MNAVDTNVFIYALDDDEPIKQSAAHVLFERLKQQPGQTIFPWQVAAEFLGNLRKRELTQKISTAEVEAYFRDFLAMFPLILRSLRIFQISFDLRSRFSLSHWDAMLLAACKDAGVTTLFSEDMDAGTDFDGLKIVNPFA